MIVGVGEGGWARLGAGWLGTWHFFIFGLYTRVFDGEAGGKGVEGGGRGFRRRVSLGV